MLFILPYVREHLNGRVRGPRGVLPICPVPHSGRVSALCMFLLFMPAKKRYFVKEAKIKRKEKCSV